MMSVHSPFRAHCNLPVTTAEPDLTRARYNSSAIDIISHNITSDITISGPLSLPRFVFPAKVSHNVSSPRLSPINTLNQRKNSPRTLRSEDSICARDISCSGLSQPSPMSCCESPPVSPRTTTPRTTFHKRGTSELIGADQLTSSKLLPARTSLNVDAMILSKPAGSISQRRGHAHRRSAAISSGDLSIILKPKNFQKTGGSLPNSPNFEHASSTFLQSLPNEMLKLGKDQITQNKETSPTLKSPKNIRVGFSDNVQIIPRSLSLVSSDSASSMRQGHSVSNSISSTVSANIKFSTKTDELSISSTELNRPRTAEPTLQSSSSKTRRHAPKRSGSLPTLKVPTSEPLTDVSTPRSSKRWTFFGNELTNAGTSPTSSLCDNNEVENVNCIKEDERKPHNIQFQEPILIRRSSGCKKSIKKQKRVKSWAGSILSNKSKQRTHKQKLRLNSPSLPKLITSTFNVEIEEPERTKSPSTKQECETDYVNWKPRKYQPQDEAVSPIIDLDAALGPFNTPSPNFGETWDTSHRNGSRKRAMHSAVGLGCFSGPGMHYHRRTESAPEFENLRFGFYRLGSGSKMTMEDVFEEDEDEEWEDTKTPNIDENPKSLCLPDDNKPELKNDARSNDSINHVRTGLMEQNGGIIDQQTSTENIDQSGNKAQPIIQSKPVLTTSLNDMSAKNRLIFSNEAHHNSIPRRESAVQLPKISILDNGEIDEVSSNGLHSASLHFPSSSPDTPYFASHIPLPSPVSPFSYDSQFTSTKQPSIPNEREFESLLLGGPGPEMRISVDDVPSLMSSDSISSDSTTTGENLSHNHTNEERFRDGQRSASFSATIMNRKRSSIISLSRLINSSHGERSKLAIETHTSCHSEGEVHQKSENLGRRISRIIKFWRKAD